MESARGNDEHLVPEVRSSALPGDHYDMNDSVHIRPTLLYLERVVPIGKQLTYWRLSDNVKRSSTKRSARIVEEEEETRHAS